MLNLFIQLSTLAVVLTGLIAMARGDWHHFALKYAAVAISTTGCVFMIILHLLHPEAGGVYQNEPLHFDYALDHISRNIALLLFNIAAGRDALGFKRHDRRRGIEHGLRATR